MTPPHSVTQHPLVAAFAAHLATRASPTRVTPMCAMRNNWRRWPHHHPRRWRSIASPARICGVSCRRCTGAGFRAGRWRGCCHRGAASFSIWPRRGGFSRILAPVCVHPSRRRNCRTRCHPTRRHNWSASKATRPWPSVIARCSSCSIHPDCACPNWRASPSTGSIGKRARCESGERARRSASFRSAHRRCAH